ncbi:MAG TPA: hypothetical protein VG942_15265 [Hyphomonadaceae bacterium]|nr:hypothetical protein [Hyphomonadaceae bacterium]
MRFLSGLLLALVVTATASGQAPLQAPAPQTPKAGSATPPVKLPEVPLGQWDEGILKDAKTQSFGDEKYAAIDFERLQSHVDSICHYDKAANIIGQPVATIGTFRQNMGWPALVDGRQIDIFRTPNESDKVILPFILVDVTEILTDVREDPYFKACGGLNFRVCTVALYGRFEWREAKNIPDWTADLTVGDKKCIFKLEHYRKMGLVDYGGAVGKVTLVEFYKGLAPKLGKH